MKTKQDSVVLQGMINKLLFTKLNVLHTIICGRSSRNNG